MDTELKRISKELMITLKVYLFDLVALGKDDPDAYYNIITLLIEGNDAIQVDFANAYKFANLVTVKGHTYGTYLFAMLNEYQLGSIIKTCEITIEFFKQVAERNLSAKRKFDLASKMYKDGYYKIAALIYIELAEEGYEVKIIDLVWSNKRRSNIKKL